MLTETPELERRGLAMRGAASLWEIDHLKTGKRAARSAQMPLRFFQQRKERISVRIVSRQGEGDAALQRGSRAVQMHPVMSRGNWRAQAAKAIGRLTEPCVCGLHWLEIHYPLASGGQSFQQEAGKLNKRAPKRLVEGLGLEHITQHRIGQVHVKVSSMELESFRPAGVDFWLATFPRPVRRGNFEPRFS
jgi:hypothetical protein